MKDQQPLVFRYLYKTRSWQSLQISKIILIVFVFSAISGVLVACVLTYCTQSFILQPQLENTKPDQVLGVIIGQLVFLTFTYQVIACGWGFIYIYSIENRKVHTTQLNNLRLQNSLKDAQLASLSNQLNPHFLFNSLNNIRFVIYENQKKADDMITNLAQLLRYSLESSQKEKVRLCTELEIIEKFIEIQSIQLEHRLIFEVKVEAHLKKYLMPPMLLQLLVENAIKHGIEQLPEGGNVLVNINEKNNELVFMVTNDKPAENLKFRSDKTTKIGLVNIKQRLELLYDALASIKVINQSDTFKVIITLPKEV
ncbi:sensor histidine kinase [Pseudoalteromonas denitrificans]|uniref:Histidine kinase n=1 Tax=Pseudoalteromonas denitrificans DSM 6059 TaxID=1123010 RepID=A0A1I1V2F4_9GAMM|nr:histidine kinase [Pseudoalteromonas denitrificans]SFD77221.1 Histidine kinase [Pseudoalteromonas denitrificans DSM 6059]